jgi:hypothetical protein
MFVEQEPVSDTDSRQGRGVPIQRRSIHTRVGISALSDQRAEEDMAGGRQTGAAATLVSDTGVFLRNAEGPPRGGPSKSDAPRPSRP